MRGADLVTPDSITVLLVGTHPGDPAVADLSSGPIEPIGRADHADQALAAIEVEPPDVVVIGATVDAPCSRQLCRAIREHSPVTRVLRLTTSDDEDAYTFVATGGIGVVVEPSGPDLARAVVGAARGESLLSPRAATRLLHDIDAWAARSADPVHPPPTLTATEREVLTRLGGGDSPADIAADHSVTDRLVNLHTGYAVAKLQRYVIGAERLAADV